MRPKELLGDIVFNIIKTSALARLFIALALAGGAIAALVPVATSATLSRNSLEHSARIPGSS